MADHRTTKIVVRAEDATPFDAAGYLKSEEAMAGYVEACFKDGDRALSAAALGDISRAHGIIGSP